MLLAAMAVAVSGCAHEAGLRQAAVSEVKQSSPAETARAQTPEPAGPASVISNARTEIQIKDEGSQMKDEGAEPEAKPAPDAESDESPKLTLEYLSRLAVENHPLLRRDEARIDAAAGSALQAGLYPNPRFDTNNPQVFNGPNTALNVGFQQDIVVKGKLRLDRAAALRAQQQSEFALVQDRYALLAQLRNQFYQTLAAQYRVDVLSRLLKVTELSVTIGKELVTGGTATVDQVKLLEIDYNRVLADLRNAERLLVGEREQLAAIVGFPELMNERVVGSLTVDPPAFDEAVMRQFVTSENAMVQIAKLDIDKNRILLKRAEAEPYPNITLGPAYQYGFNKTQEQYWMTIVFPIPVSDRNQGNIRSARANIRDSTEALGTVQLELLRKLADLYSTHRGAREQADRYKTHIIPDSREALRLVRSGYRNGITEFAVYLQAQRTVIDATKDYVDILEKVWTSAADLSGLLQMDKFP
jgi:cobalt-zinc-cadmium efflux system outer membrane protein